MHDIEAGVRFLPSLRIVCMCADTYCSHLESWGLVRRIAAVWDWAFYPCHLLFRGMIFNFGGLGVNQNFARCALYRV